MLPLGVSWGSLGCLLGPPGSSLGASWRPLGALLRPLGAFLRPLGGALARGPKFGRFLVPFWEPKGLPEGTQNRAQDGPKSIIILNVKKVPLQDRLGCVLGRSWDLFGAILGGKNLQIPLRFPWFFENQLFGKNHVLRAVLEPTWSQLDLPRAPRWSPRGTQNGTKNGSKKHQILIMFLIDFWSHFGCLLGSILELLGGQVGTKLAPRWLLRRDFCQKVDFQKNQGKPNGFSRLLLP